MTDTRAPPPRLALAPMSAPPAPDQPSTPHFRTEDEAHRWLRSRGLAQVLPRSVRIKGIGWRISGLLVLLASGHLLLGALALLVTPLTDSEGVITATDAQSVAIAAFVLGGPALVLLLAWMVARLARRGSDARRAVIAIATALLWLVVTPIVTTRMLRSIEPGESSYTQAMIQALLIYVVLGFLTYLGTGTVVRWSLRRSRQELAALGPMIVRVLPVLMLAVLFLFFNAEIWQVAAGLDGPRTAAVASVLAVLAVSIVIVTARDELRRMIHERPDRHPLRLGERINLTVIPVAAQLSQVAIFAAMMWFFFVLFGSLSISDSVAKAWIAHPPTPAEALGVVLPISTELLKVAAILATFCGLSFAASSGSDATYREAFLDAILEETRASLDGRDVYCEQFRATGGR